MYVYIHTYMLSIKNRNLNRRIRPGPRAEASPISADALRAQLIDDV